MFLVILGIMLIPLFFAVRLFIKTSWNVFNNGDDSEYWHFGIYYNKNDRRRFVPSRFGWGRSRNYGNPQIQILLWLRMIFVAAIMLVWFFKTNGAILNTVLIIIIIILIAFLVHSIKLSVRMRNESDEDDKDSKDCFLFFYNNKSDKRVFVPYRYTRGWTINLGNIYGRILFLFQMVAMIFIVIFICRQYINRH